jgi:GMP synthase (glutamine-hydrolysing)
VVISGSRTSIFEEAPWIAHLDETIRRLVDLGKPVLGVCYGHQALNRALGGKQTLRKATAPEFGWTRIETTAPSPLFQGLPQAFYSFSAHFEEVGEVAPGMVLFARSEACSVQACQLGTRPIFGIQFHPEKDLADATRSLAERKRIGEPKLLLHPADGPKLYDPKIGETVFRNLFST